LIEDSYVGAFFIGIPDNTPVAIDSLVPGYFDYWSARENISESLTYNLVLRRTGVMENTKGYKGGMEIGWNIAVDAVHSIITISNSRLNKLIISYPEGEPAFVSDLVTRQPVSFDLNNIHLVNTEIQTQWGIFMNGGPAEIINSEGLFIFMTGGDADIIVFNSEVGEIDPRNYTGTLIYENCTWLGGYEIFDSSHIKITGNVRMLPTVPIFDQSSTGDSFEEDKRIFQGVLSLLYIARRQNARDAGMGIVEMERLLGCPQEHLEFHVWYLKEKGWLERLENGKLAISSDGIDKVVDGDLMLRKDRMLTDGAGTDEQEGPIEESARTPRASLESNLDWNVRPDY